MRSQILFDNYLKLYRQIALVCTLLAVGLFGALLYTFFQPPHGLAEWLLMMGIAGLCVAVIAGVLVAGHRSLGELVKKATRLEEQSVSQIHLDSLTGAMIRSRFLDAMKSTMRRSQSQSLGYVQVDMDNLKSLNDGSGHKTGDAALAHLVATIQAILPDAIVGRLGGDEFGILITGYDKKSAIKRVCEQILKELDVPFMVEGRTVRVGATMGIACVPEDATSSDELMSKADLALYRGKKSGRNMVVVFEEEMHQDERHRRFVERELRAAILMNELEVHYQPIVSAKTLQPRSYEALVRWNHSVRGLIPPSEFIHVAEKSDLIDKLGDWMLSQVCADFAKLDAPCVSINVSAVQLRRSDFAERFGAILEKTGIAGEKVVVEVTETVPLAGGGCEKANLDGLRALGVKIAIDDFGAGNASLAYLKGFSFDVLKIDRSYVKDVVENRLDSMMVSAVCRLARTAGMIVVAEGVETEEQFKLLRSLGCTSLQGYLLGRPQPLRQIIADRSSGARSQLAA
jgi:diguanylate cyclase (GGDEF)-like protein